MIDRKIAALWALECAEKVLHVFEMHNSDTRPRHALEVLKMWMKDEVKCSIARKTSSETHAAARECEEGPVRWAARTCGHAVATAHVATHARVAAWYMLKVIKSVSPEKYKQNLEWIKNREKEIWTQPIKHSIY